LFTNVLLKTLIFTATYNEAGNIQALVEDILHYVPTADVLVVDDNSPDGTGNILDQLAKEYTNIKAIHRTGKLGLGTAHLMAMQYAVEQGYDVLVTMDADFSHHPKYLPTMLKLSDQYDFVIGSRYMKGGGLGYGFVRTFISKSANLLARTLLSIRLQECTTSYRAFRLPLLKKILTHKVNSEGYSFFFEMVYLVTRLTDNVTEFPIYFADRTKGESKISKNEIYRGVTTLFYLFGKRFL
jgi:dolichol-phosphate mannosyltransferase